MGVANEQTRTERGERKCVATENVFGLRLPEPCDGDERFHVARVEDSVEYRTRETPVVGCWHHVPIYAQPYDEAADMAAVIDGGGGLVDGRYPDCPYCVRLHPDERCTCVPSVNDPFGADLSSGPLGPKATPDDYRVAERDAAMCELDEAIGAVERVEPTHLESTTAHLVRAVRAAFDRLRGSAK